MKNKNSLCKGRHLQQNYIQDGQLCSSTRASGQEVRTGQNERQTTIPVKQYILGRLVGSVTTNKKQAVLTQDKEGRGGVKCITGGFSAEWIKSSKIVHV